MERPVLGVGGVVVFRERGEVVLVRRKHPPNAGQWTLPGGRVEPGERLAAACARELFEETGLVVTVDALLEVVEILGDGRHYVVVDYRCTPVGGDLRAGDDAAEVARVPIAELDRYALTDEVRRVIGKAVA